MVNDGKEMESTLEHLARQAGPFSAADMVSVGLSALPGEALK